MKDIRSCPIAAVVRAGSHEVAQGYKEIKTDTVYVKFKVKGADEYFQGGPLPLTLASNVALTVNPMRPT